MEDAEEQYGHPTGDDALSLLSTLPGVLGSFVDSFPGSQVSDDLWLDQWFNKQTTYYYEQTESEGNPVLVHKEYPSFSEKPPAIPVRLKLIEPHYFRGFRAIPEPINVDGNLVVFEGRNSSGKTSLAEALEWLFTGELSRRKGRDLGSPRELQNCITNEFCAEGEQTWVKATFEYSSDEGTKTITLCRVLKSDYGIKKESKCFSTLFKDDVELSIEEERKELDRLFASEPPLLMQHTLRDFVQSDPRERRNYFERLLKLQELTTLISKAVVGDSKIKEYQSPTGSKSLNDLKTLESSLEDDHSKKLCSQLYKENKTNLADRVNQALIVVAQRNFSEQVKDKTEIDQIKIVLQQEQDKAKQRTFPLLERLRPTRILEEKHVINHEEEVKTLISAIKEAWSKYESAKNAALSIGNERVIISQILKILLEKDIIDIEHPTQTCPLCEYADVETLTAERITEISGWDPIQEAEKKTQQALLNEFNKLLEISNNIVKEWAEYFPHNPSQTEWENALLDSNDEMKAATDDLRDIHKTLIGKYGEHFQYLANLNKTPFAIPQNSTKCEEYLVAFISNVKVLDTIAPFVRRYRESFLKIESTAGSIARVDPKYRLREICLVCMENQTSIFNDLRWEHSKVKAQNELEVIREALIEYRKHFLEARRLAFNDGIELIWKSLRADQYSSFSELHVPEPRGKGFPVEMEVKAVLDDGDKKKVVDALRVFSESQVNALGIAAFVTRSKLLGHKILIFDDPVQSMDEEHFITFAKDVLNHILEQGFQVILLTHNDTFARDVSYYHQDRPEPEYVTMKTILNKKKGCLIEEGNRRVFERLKRAEKEIDEAHFEDAWASIRRSVERMYIITQQKYGPLDFNPRIWQDQAAESMWGNGVGEIIEEKVPGAGKELKQIISNTVAGSHDKSPRGETDIRNSIKYLRNLMNELRLGG